MCDLKFSFFALADGGIFKATLITLLPKLSKH